MRYAHHVVLALVLAAPAGAQQPPLSLREALELARLHSPLLPVAAGHVRVAEGLARERAAPPNPTIELRQENVGGAPVLDRFATVTLPLDLRLERSAIRAAGRQFVAAATADSATAVRQVESTVGRLYWSAALAHALAESAAMEEAALTDLLSFEETRFEEGSVSEAVALRARLEVERARLATARAWAAAEQAHADLARSIGLPAADLSPAELETRLFTAIPTPSEAVERALLARPEVEAARRRVEAARWGTTAARRGSLPGLGLQLGAMESAGRASAIVALSVELPVRDLGAGARARAAGELAVAEAELAAVQRRIESEVASALEVYRRLMDAEPTAGSDLNERGAQVAAIAEMAYREGAVTLVELLDARRAHAEARASAATRAAEVAIARIELSRVTGSRIEEGI